MKQHEEQGKEFSSFGIRELLEDNRPAEMQRRMVTGHDTSCVGP